MFNLDSHIVPISPHSSPFNAYAPRTPPRRRLSALDMSYPPPDKEKDVDHPPKDDDGLKSFLGLAPRLWLTAFNPGFLPLIFTIAHLAATRASTAQLAAQLKESVLDACESIASGAGALQALPRYLAMQTNAEMLRATRATVLAVGSALMDCITVIEVVVNFIVDTYRSLLLCTLQLVVQGSLELLISAVQTVSGDEFGRQ